jgi:hypothetical protein
MSRLSTSLSTRKSLSPTREGDGSRLPRIQEDPATNPNYRRSHAKEEMSSPPPAPRHLIGGPGKPSDGDGGVGFRCESMPTFDACIDVTPHPLLRNSLYDHSLPS